MNEDIKIDINSINSDYFKNDLDKNTEEYIDSIDIMDNKNINNNKDIDKDNKQVLECKEWNNPKKRVEIQNYINDIRLKINKKEKEKEELKNEIEKKDINIIFENYSKYITYKIGGLNNLDFLIYMEFSDNPNFSEIKKLDKSKLEIYKYRDIAGDGNCFYRSVIFYFLENIILSFNTNLMEEFIKLFDEKINVEDNFIKENNFRELKTEYKNKIIEILYIILEYMEENNQNAYTFFLKAYLFEKNFDYYLIFFTRYLIYEYISSNEDKLYSKNKNIKDKNDDENLEIKFILPEKYIGKPFKNYYIEHLLKMNEMAESLDINIIPYIFQCDINIRQLKYIENKKEKKLEEIPYIYKCGLNGVMEIDLLYNGIHYDVFYKKEYYNKYCQQLDNLINIIDTKYMQEKEFLKPHILESYSKYLKYLQSNNISNTVEERKKFFSKIEISDDKLLIDYINENGYDLDNIISQLKKNECVFCKKSIQNNKYFMELPCRCVICTEECFKNYLKPQKIENSDEKENGKYYDHITICDCEYENKKKDIKKIILRNIDNIDKIKDSDIKDENYRKIVENHWLWKCNFCRNDSFNRRFRFYRLIFNEKYPSTNNNLEHLICFTCKNTKIPKDKNIECSYCEEKHLISSIKNVSEDNEIESSCHII